jgi:hypothetical protein
MRASETLNRGAGVLYLLTSLAFGISGGIEALLKLPSAGAPGG